MRINILCRRHIVDADRGNVVGSSVGSVAIVEDCSDTSIIDDRSAAGVGESDSEVLWTFESRVFIDVDGDCLRLSGWREGNRPRGGGKINAAGRRPAGGRPINRHCSGGRLIQRNGKYNRAVILIDRYIVN